MSSNFENNRLRSRFWRQTIFLATLTFSLLVAGTEAQTSQVSPNGDSRSIVATAIRKERAALLGFRQVWTTADQKTVLTIEVVKPDRLHTVQQNHETLLMGDRSYDRKGNGPWIANEFVVVGRIPEGNVEEEVKRIEHARLIGADTVDDQRVLVYEYGQNDATGNALGDSTRIWIGVEDGLPHKAENEGPYPSISEGPKAKAGGTTEEPRMVTVKVVTTFDYRGAIIVDLPEPAAREAAESWLQSIDSGRYAESWTEASEVLKQRYSGDAWETRLNEFAKHIVELKLIRPRKLLSLESVKSSSANHDRELELSYKTYFEKSGLVQQLKLVLDSNQVWRVADYTAAFPDRFGNDASGFESRRPGGEHGMGTGSGGGLGTGNGRGVGPGNGYNMGGGDPRLGGGSGGPATSVDTKPIPLNNPKPQYTEEARKNKIQGNVTVRLLVGADGLVKQVKVTRGLPDGLDEQAIRTAYQMRFKPAMKGGNAVAYWMPVLIEFKLQ